MWALILLAFGAFLSFINFYLSFLCYPVHIFRGGNRADYKWVSGFPLVGTLFIVLALVADGLERPIVLYTGLIALFMDTGGVLWIIGQALYARLTDRS
jgi:hypothetical protein